MIGSFCRKSFICKRLRASGLREMAKKAIVLCWKMQVEAMLKHINTRFLADFYA